MKDCNVCSKRWSCIIACPEINERLVEIDNYLTKEEEKK